MPRDGRGHRSCGGVSSRRVTRDGPAGHVPRRVTSPVSVLLSAVKRAARRSVRDCRCRGAQVAPIAGLERSSVGCRPPPPVSPTGADSLSRRSGCSVNPCRARLEVRLDVVVAATLPIYRWPTRGRLHRPHGLVCVGTTPPAGARHDAGTTGRRWSCPTGLPGPRTYEGHPVGTHRRRSVTGPAMGRLISR